MVSLTSKEYYYYYYYYYYVLILQIERGSVRDRVWNGDDEFDEFFDVVVVFLSLGVGGWGRRFRFRRFGRRR